MTHIIHKINSGDSWPGFILLRNAYMPRMINKTLEKNCFNWRFIFCSLTLQRATNPYFLLHCASSFPLVPQLFFILIDFCLFCHSYRCGHCKKDILFSASTNTGILKKKISKITQEKFLQHFLLTREHLAVTFDPDLLYGVLIGHDLVSCALIRCLSGCVMWYGCLTEREAFLCVSINRTLLWQLLGYFTGQSRKIFTTPHYKQSG